jgi:hypothetical protein
VHPKAASGKVLAAAALSEHERYAATPLKHASA